jgi:hypothetical protein
MTGQATWLTLLVIVAGVAWLAGMVWWSKRVWTRFRTIPEVRVCPHARAPAGTLLRFDTQMGRFTKVERCDLLDNPDEVTCDQACLHR